MAIYHFTVRVMSRANSRNAIAGATYRHGQAMTDEKSGKVFTNATHQDVEHCELSIPENSPQWVKELLVGDVHKNSEKLWNAVESFEKRIDAQVYRDVEFSLPHELSFEQRLDLAREFIKEQFTSRGMIADWCVHNHFDEKEGIEQPHVHVMLTMREAIERDETVFQKLKSYVGLSSASSEIFFGPKVVEWNSKALLCNWREKWADCANVHLAKAGLDIRIDHRSYEDQGIELIPQPKLGKSVSEMSNRGHYVDRFEEMRTVQEKNKELIRSNPSLVLDYITRYQSTFTRQDIAKLLNRYIDDAKEFQLILGQIEASEQLVTLSANEQGEAVKLTTKDMIRLEKHLVEMAIDRALNPSCPPSLSSLELSLNKGNEKLKEQGGLSSDQVHAIQHMVADGQLKVVVGYAGAGKTTCLDVAQDVWKESGYRVVGAAPTGKAAANLESIGISSKTLHKWEQEWKRDRDLLNKNTVLILDEAGMVDSGRLHYLLTQSKEQGFKLVLVGDPEQLPPIEAGAPTRAIMETVGFAELSTIVRQKVDWQKEASQHLATHQTEKALEAYHQNNTIHYSKDAKNHLIQDWIEHGRRDAGENGGQHKDHGASSLILAYTNQDVKDLNHLARLEMQKEGLLDDYHYRFTISKPLNLETLDQGQKDSIDNSFKPKTIREERDFAIGDQIVFSRNDYGLNVRNGQLAKIVDIQEELITVQKEDRSSLTFDMGNYNHIDHGYATTIHKSQGTTVDKTFVYASPYLNKHLTYVALTRHKEEMQLYVDTTLMLNKDALIQALSKEAPKENALDYILDKDQLMDIRVDDQRAFMQRRSISASSLPYISWESIKEFSYKAWAQAKDWMFGDLGQSKASLDESPQTLADIGSIAESIAKNPPIAPGLPTLPQASLSASQTEIVKEILTTHSFDLPEEVSGQQYHQLVANTFSYLKAIQFDEMASSKEKELLAKACFIQSHVQDIEMDYRNDNWSSEKILAITAMASHLWYQGKDDPSYSFEKSCLTSAPDLYDAYQGLFPKAIAAYQRMYPDLPEGQLNILTQQAIQVAQFSNQLLTEENLETMAQPFLEATEEPRSKIAKDVLELENNRFLQSMLKDKVFGEITQENTLKAVSKSSEVLNVLSELPPLSLSENQLKAIQETQATYYFPIPEGLQEQHYYQLVAHTFSYLKSIHLEATSPSKEHELLVKACFIQCHLKDVALDEKNQDCSTQQIFALTAMASQLWYQGKDDSSYSFEQSCLAHAADLQTAYQNLFPKVIAAYQHMFSHLPEGQLNTLAQQAIDIEQISNQPLTQENLNTLAQSFFKTPALVNDREHLKSGQNLSSLSEPLAHSDEKQQKSHSSMTLKLDPSSKKHLPPEIIVQVVDQYRAEHQAQMNEERQLHLVHELKL
jgi:Ti-type conjugative transfer relaxase TraA